MQAFFEVVLDLLKFIHETILGKNAASRGVSHKAPPALFDVRSPVPSLQVSAKHQSYDGSAVVGPEAYVMTTTWVHTRPMYAFDTGLVKVMLGTKVVREGTSGEFAYIVAGGIKGWVHQDVLTNDRNLVWPSLVTGVVYSASHENTMTIRNLISDVFCATEPCLPLQPQEYVTYRLKEQGRALPDVTERPRTVGVWHRLYRAQPGVVMSIEPKTNALIEGSLMTTRPYLGIVAEVHIDKSIVVETVGRYKDGEYQKELLSQDEWRETQPVFIQL